MPNNGNISSTSERNIDWKAVLAFIAVLLLAAVVYWAVTARITGATYYVDCTTGKDTNNGTAASRAWRSVDKANTASLKPGDQLLFKRGCVWEGTLEAGWTGTPSQPITIGAYGEGALPLIQNGPKDLADQYHNNVDVTGSYLVISSINTLIVNPPTDPSCQNTPVGFYVGFNFRNMNNTPNGGSYNVLEYSKASGHTAGVQLGPNTHNDRIIDNALVNNNVMSVLTPKGQNSDDDIGAWGILVRGSDDEIARNYFSNNRARCTYDTPPQGNAVELYEAQRVQVHHNVSVEDRVFSELGSSPQRLSADNTYAYNLVVSTISDAHFIITRGHENLFGPIPETRVLNNTVYFTGADSEGIVCGAGCNSSVLTVKNNIIWAEKKAIFADDQFPESNNIFWSNDGHPLVQLLHSVLSSHSMIIDPRFADPDQCDFQLKSTSPAIDSGINVSWTQDLDSISVPQGGIPDIGSFEYPTHSNPSASGGKAPLTSLLVKLDVKAVPVCPIQAQAP